VLFRLTVSTGLEKTEIPLETKILKGYPFVDYADSFRIELLHNQNIDSEDAAILVMQQMYPIWLKAPDKKHFTDYFAQRSEQTNGWKLVHKSSNEIVISLNRSHIDLRLSILLRKEKDRTYLYLITIAKFNNLMGYLYFIPVKFGHQIVMANTLRKVKWCLIP
jgi:retron-type reverse transcriptase